MCSWDPGAAFKRTLVSPSGTRGFLPPLLPPGGRNCEGSASRAAAAILGAPGRPFRAVELTGSVCPTGRAALAVWASALPSDLRRRQPGRDSPRSPGAPHQEFPPWGLAQVPPQEPRPRPRGTAPTYRCRVRVAGLRAEELPKPSGMGAARRGLPLARPRPPCRSWGSSAGASARTRFTAAEVRPGRLPARPSLFPVTCWLSLSLPGSAEGRGPARGRGVGTAKTGVGTGAGLGIRIRASLQTHL